MKVYKAFLSIELITLKRTCKFLPLFFCLPIGASLAPYLNQYNFSGIHFSQEIAPYIAIIAFIFANGIFSSVFAMTSITFEKTNNIHWFLFSLDISKEIYIAAKLTIPIILTVIGTFAPSIIMYSGVFYPRMPINIAVLIIYMITTSIIWTFVSILCSQFFNCLENITLSTLAIMVIWILGLAFLLAPWNRPYLFCAISITITLIMFKIVVFVLNKRESKIYFEV